VSGLLCISFTAIFTKWANVPGPVSAVWRMTIAAVVLALPFIRQVRHWTPAARLNIAWGIAGGLAFALNLGLLNTALLPAHLGSNGHPARQHRTALGRHRRADRLW